MEDYNVTVHDPAAESLSLAVIILLFIFFPIGIIVFIVRTINRLKTDRINRKNVKADTEQIKTNTSILQATAIESYYDLYQKGILSQQEFEAQKNAILSKPKGLIRISR